MFQFITPQNTGSVGKFVPGKIQTARNFSYKLTHNHHFNFQVLVAFSAAEKEKLGPYTSAYEDVYDVTPPRIQKQLDETKAHVEKHKEHYNLEKYVRWTSSSAFQLAYKVRPLVAVCWEWVGKQLTGAM